MPGHSLSGASPDLGRTSFILSGRNSKGSLERLAESGVGRRVGIPHRVAPLRFVRRLADFAATFKKGANVQVEGELRSREYEKDGVKHRVFECRLESVLKLDRAERRGADESDGPES
jgi:hypothetical protein